MHKIFEEIGQHLKQAHYKGEQTTYRKSIGMVEVIVELEKGDEMKGFKIAVGSHPHMELEKHKGKGRKVHVRDCPGYKFITDEEGSDIWKYHQSIEARVSMINRILREVYRFEKGAGA